MSLEERREIRKIMIAAILATDMSFHMALTAKIQVRFIVCYIIFSLNYILIILIVVQSPCSGG